MDKNICCIHCHKLYSQKGINTHYLRSHGTESEKSKFSSGHNGKYHQVSEKLKSRAVQKYLESINVCQCGEIIPFDKRHNQYCSRTCANIFKERSSWDEFQKMKNKARIDSFRVKVTVHRKNCRICNSRFGTSKRTSFCSDKCRSTFHRDLAFKKEFGGKRNSKRFKSFDSFGNKVTLESSYEVLCSELLNELNIDWIRPKFIQYYSSGVKKRYYPDFYLPEHDVYLDPKNDYLIKIDSDKIKLVQEQNDIIIHIVSFEELNKEGLLALLS